MSGQGSQLGLFGTAPVGNAQPAEAEEPNPVIDMQKLPFETKALHRDDVCAKCGKDKWDHYAGIVQCSFWTAEAWAHFKTGKPLRGESKGEFCYGCCAKERRDVKQCRISKRSGTAVTWYRLCEPCRDGYASAANKVEVWNANRREYEPWKPSAKSQPSSPSVESKLSSSSASGTSAKLSEDLSDW